MVSHQTRDLQIKCLWRNRFDDTKIELSQSGIKKFVHFRGIYFESAFGQLSDLTSFLPKTFFGCFEVASQKIVQIFDPKEDFING